MATLSVQGTAHCTDVCIYTVLMYLSWTNVSTLGSSIYIRPIYHTLDQSISDTTYTWHENS